MTVETTTGRDEGARWVLGPWDLRELPETNDSDSLDRALAALDEQAAAFEKRRGELSTETPVDVIIELVLAYEALVESSMAVGGRASLEFSANTQSDQALTALNRVRESSTRLENRVLFFRLWWQSLDDDHASKILSQMRERNVPDQVFFLEDLRRLANYQLDERSEQIINLKDANGISGVLTLYSMITNAFGFEPDIEDVKQEGRALTRDELTALFYSPKPGDRRAAYREQLRVYRDHSKVLGQMYVNRVRDWHSEQVELRGYRSAIDVRNVANDVPGEAIEALLTAVEENVGIFQRYFGLKAQWLGLERPSRFDIYAPLKPSDERVPYSEAVDLVVDTYSRFDGRAGDLVRRVFDEGHVDSEIRPGKKGGAFCATLSPKVTPYVLVNYAGRLRDVATIAHELGHALHSLLANGHSVMTQSSSLPLAETASVFGEMLMVDRLLEERDDPSAQREILASSLDDIYATVCRQAFFVLFEKRAHQAIQDGASQEELHRLYASTLTQQFGSEMVVDDEFAYEWLGIPHMYATPFYCYAYSFGQLLVVALYQRYKELGEAFKPGYLRMLAHGGSARPETVLREAQVDARDPEFWRGGFRVVEDMVDRLEALSSVPS